MKNSFFKSCKGFRLLALTAVICSFQINRISPPPNPVVLKVIFINEVNGKKIVLNDSAYTNPFGEKYTISKLRYYVTNVSLQKGNTEFKEKNSYHLIDESNPGSQMIKLLIPGGNYFSFNFLLGVDSLHNVSGAQTDDLDPEKDMFWTWNNGYVMAKMEGNSPDSKLVNHKFEYHIGGFSGPYNVLKELHLNFPGKVHYFEGGKAYEIVINVDLNKWWQGAHDIKISDMAIIASPGKNALNLSDNYARMFQIGKIISD